MAEVRIERLHKQFPDGTVAIRELDLTIAEGELFVLLGPSGCGKTTTLRCIAGLEQQTSGDILIGGRRVNDLRAADRDIAMVFQFYALYPHLSAYDNMSFPLRAQGIPGEEIERRVQRTARMLRIEELLQRKPSKLSGGEQQRIALGRAAVREPQVFLMDEPLTNLDAELRADMRAEVKRLQERLGTTMVYVTHDQVEAMALGHRIAIMRDGELEQVGTPLEVYRSPRSLFAASFIGTPPMNLFAVEVDDGALRGPAGLRLPRPDHVRADAHGLTAGVRAEWLTLTESDGERPAARIVAREALGDETLYVVDADGDHLHVRMPPTAAFTEEQTVGLRFTGDAPRVYDTESGMEVGT